nr:unnamed protein product [Callosobruchus analis]
MIFPVLMLQRSKRFHCPSLPQIVTDYLPSPPSGSSQDFATAHVSGYILKKLLAKLDCSICKNLMVTREEVDQNQLIKLRQFKNCNLTLPTQDFSKSVNEITDLIFTALPLYHKDAFTKQLLDICINVLVFHYIRRINRILNGKDLRHKDDDILTQKYSQKVHIRRRKD